MTEEGTPLERDAAWSLMVALVAPLTCQVEVLNFHLHANTGMYSGCSRVSWSPQCIFKMLCLVGRDTEILLNRLKYDVNKWRRRVGAQSWRRRRRDTYACVQDSRSSTDRAVGSDVSKGHFNNDFVITLYLLCFFLDLFNVATHFLRSVRAGGFVAAVLSWWEINLAELPS